MGFLNAIANTVENAVEDVGDAAEDAVDAVEDAAEDVADAATDAAEAVQESAEDAADALGNAAESAGDAVQDAADDIGEAASDAVEEVGETIDEGFDSAGDAFPPLDDELDSVGDTISDIFDIAGATVKSGFDIAGAAVGGGVKITGGALAGDDDLVTEGAGDVVATAIGGVLVTVGTTISGVQNGFSVQDEMRTLTEKEISTLRLVFGDSLSYDSIRLITGAAGVYDLNDNPFTLGNKIYLKDDKLTSALLIHECTHVWQYQHQGVRYVTDALSAQTVHQDAYDWLAEIQERDTQSWSDLNAESQAEFLEDVWLHGQKTSDPSSDDWGAFYEARPGNRQFPSKSAAQTHIQYIDNNVEAGDYTAFADDAHATVQSPESARGWA